MSSIYGDSRQIEIANRWFTGGISKAQLAREYNISSRTVGRYIEKWINPEWQEEQEEECAVLPDECQEPEYKWVFSVTPEKCIVIRTNLDTGEIDHASASSDDDVFDVALGCCYDYLGFDRDDSYLEDAFNAMHTPSAIQIASHGRVTADVANNELRYTSETGRDVSFSGRLVGRVMEAINSGDSSIDKILKFADKLSYNPSHDALNGLYDFLEATDIEIDDDGDLICFKKVRDNYHDVYSGRFDNSVGNVVEEERNQVDPDGKVLCGKGLHCASWAYMDHYPGKRIMKVKVNPADVVAIPEEYFSVSNGEVKAKMRVCKYEVIAEVV